VSAGDIAYIVVLIVFVIALFFSFRPLAQPWNPHFSFRLFGLRLRWNFYDTFGLFMLFMLLVWVLLLFAAPE